jgi:hypothetical protein
VGPGGQPAAPAEPGRDEGQQRNAGEAGWTATVSVTTFTTSGKTAAETIPAGNGTYLISGLVATTGSATCTTAPSTTLALTPKPVVTASSVAGNNSATWNPRINVQIPAGAVTGTYTATITHSVS